MCEVSVPNRHGGRRRPRSGNPRGAGREKKACRGEEVELIYVFISGQLDSGPSYIEAVAAAHIRYVMFIWWW